MHGARLQETRQHENKKKEHPARKAPNQLPDVVIQFSRATVGAASTKMVYPAGRIQSDTLVDILDRIPCIATLRRNGQMRYNWGHGNCGSGRSWFCTVSPVPQFPCTLR
eukprot:NODE_3485_length_412_cov_33.677193_g3435_i0.p1 GENE.NODE_3485_length_412_cov_33.677193_g3435_i0~~NODE_3485_length_412_cov_33.677193_g3435_i0.p1  ORF type:complete len:109 (-),score=3.80 NODE_3485_length_412_cov_33.677193_g3435_i0:1-327(-)